MTVSARDFDRANAIYGNDIASIKGKSTKPVSAIADPSEARTAEPQAQALHIDIMFVEGLPFLIGVALPLDLTLVYELKNFDGDKTSRTAPVVQLGLESFRSALRSNGFSVSLIRCDGEKALAKLTPLLNIVKIEVDVCGAASHIPVVERRIRVVKERIRAHMTGHLPYALPKLALGLLVIYCATRLNYMPSSRQDRMSPREALTGRKPHSKDFRCSFGEYVQAVVPNTDNSMHARTDDCIVMLPTGNRTGSVKMLSLLTGQIVTRDHFTILPIPVSVIRKLNDAKGWTTQQNRRPHTATQ